MVLKVVDAGKVRTHEQLRDAVSAYERQSGKQVRVIVGVKASMTEQEALSALPLVEEQVRMAGLKFAATTIIIPGVGMTTLNILFKEYLNIDNAAQNFVIKQKKYELQKVFFMD